MTYILLGKSGIKDLMAQAGIFSEGVRSNALIRCCKDLGIARDLWDPSFIQAWKAKYTEKKATQTSFGKTFTYSKK